MQPDANASDARAMRWPAWGLRMLLPCAVLTTTPRADAQAPADAVIVDRTRAASFYLEGKRSFTQERWELAEVAYLKAWALVKSFDVAANLGQVELNLKKPRSAAEHLVYSLRTAPLSLEPAQMERTQHFLAEAKKLVTTLRVKVSVAKATVLVDGKEVGTSPIEHDLFLEPGKRTITASLPGHDDAAQTVEAKRGESIQVELAPTLARAAVMTPVGEPMHEAPAPRMQPPEARSWVPTIALGAANVVGLGVAVGLTVASNDASEDLSAQTAVFQQLGEQCVEPSSAFAGRCSQLRDTGSRVETFGNAAIVTYAATGALAIAALTYALWPHSRASESTGVRASPEVRADGTGITIRGTW